MRLPPGPLGVPGLPLAVQLSPVTGPPTDLEVVLVGPGPDEPARLEGVSLRFTGRRLELADVVLAGSARTVLDATVSEALVLRRTVIAGARIADPTQETVVTASVAPGCDGEVLLDESWVVDCGGPQRLQGLLARAGTGARGTLTLRSSGLVANAVQHELLIDGLDVVLDGAVVIRPAAPRDTTGGVLLSAGTTLDVRDSLVAPGAGLDLVDPASGDVELRVSGSRALASADRLPALLDAGFAPGSPSLAIAAGSAAMLDASAATSAAAVRAALAGLD